MSVYNWAAYFGSGNVFDNNDSTGITINSTGYSGGGTSASATYTSSFSSSKIIDSVRYKYNLSYNWIVSTSMIVSLYYGGSWHTVASHGISSGAHTTVVNGPWTGVTGIKIYVYIYTTGFGGFATLTTHECQAKGEKYDDIGIRLYDGSDNIEIGTEALSGHKLRIRKGSTTYGIPLVATTSNYATGIRIYDGSDEKALVMATD